MQAITWRQKAGHQDPTDLQEKSEVEPSLYMAYVSQSPVLQTDLHEDWVFTVELFLASCPQSIPWQVFGHPRESTRWPWSLYKWRYIAWTTLPRAATAAAGALGHTTPLDSQGPRKRNAGKAADSSASAHIMPYARLHLGCLLMEDATQYSLKRMKAYGADSTPLATADFPLQEAGHRACEEPTRLEAQCSSLPM